MYTPLCTYAHTLLTRVTHPLPIYTLPLTRAHTLILQFLQAVPGAGTTAT